MFGYVRTDEPYLYIKDQTLYQAMYCGLCKGIGAVCGQTARFGLSYDVTFLSVLLHNIAGVDVKIEKGHCLTHRIRSKPMANVDEMTKMLGAVNTLLAYYKYTDDIADEGKGKGKRLLFQKGFKRAKKAYPALEEIIRVRLEAQEKVEKAATASLDIAADNTAEMVAAIADEVLGDKKSEATHNLFYTIGKWIYLIDALDDYDKDKEKGLYNPFLLSYGEGCRKEMVEAHEEEIAFTFHAIFSDLRENLSKIEFAFNRDLVDNVLLRGLPAQTKRVMDGCDCKRKRR